MIKETHDADIFYKYKGVYVDLFPLEPLSEKLARKFVRKHQKLKDKAAFRSDISGFVVGHGEVFVTKSGILGEAGSRYLAERVNCFLFHRWSLKGATFLLPEVSKSI